MDYRRERKRWVRADESRDGVGAQCPVQCRSVKGEGKRQGMRRIGGKKGEDR